MTTIEIKVKDLARAKEIVKTFRQLQADFGGFEDVAKATIRKG
jgi:hypothetical protein